MNEKTDDKCVVTGICVCKNIELKTPEEFLKIDWEKGPILEIMPGLTSTGDLSIAVNFESNDSSFTFNMLDFHRVFGYGSLRWNKYFSWLTKYLDRCQALNRRPGLIKWDTSKVIDLVYVLREIGLNFPGEATKELSVKTPFTEIICDDSSSSRFERVWNASFVQPKADMKGMLSNG